jgi:hypothetical protein
MICAPSSARRAGSLWRRRISGTSARKFGRRAKEASAFITGLKRAST